MRTIEKEGDRTGIGEIQAGMRRNIGWEKTVGMEQDQTKTGRKTIGIDQDRRELKR